MSENKIDAMDLLRRALPDAPPVTDELTVLGALQRDLYVFKPGMCWPCRSTGAEPTDEYRAWCDREKVEDPWARPSLARFVEEQAKLRKQQGDEDDGYFEEPEGNEPLRPCRLCEGGGMIGTDACYQRLYGRFQMAVQRVEELERRLDPGRVGG